LRNVKEEDNNLLGRLKTYLSSLAPGPAQDVPELEAVLWPCWHEFDGNKEGGMEGYKLRGRMEEVIWTPPALSFAIERHGATVNGSIHAELQYWKVDVEKSSAMLYQTERRTVGKKDKALNVALLVKPLAQAISERSNSPCLRWESDSKVKVLIAKIIPATNQQTTSARRKRFWKGLESKVQSIGWRRTSSRSQFLQREP
jgi:hypothetical protein